MVQQTKNFVPKLYFGVVDRHVSGVLYVYYILVWWLDTKMSVYVKGITNYILIARLNLA